MPEATAERLADIRQLVQQGYDHEARQHIAALLGRVDLAHAYKRLAEDKRQPTLLWSTEDYYTALSTLDKYLLLPAIKKHHKAEELAQALLG